MTCGACVMSVTIVYHVKTFYHCHKLLCLNFKHGQWQNNSHYLWRWIDNTKRNQKQVRSMLDLHLEPFSKCYEQFWNLLSWKRLVSGKMTQKRILHNPLSDGLQIWAVLRGAPPPLKTLKMKLQSHVRGRNRGSWVCPVHLDYFQLADMCISRVFTWF